MRRATGVLSFAAVLLAGCGQEEALALPSPSAASRPVVLSRASYVVEALSGRTITASDQNGVFTLRPGRAPQLRARAKGLRSVAAGPGALVLTTANFGDTLSGPYLSDFEEADAPPPGHDPADRTTVKAEIDRGGFRELTRCTGDQADVPQSIPAAAGERIVVAATCDGTGLVVLDASGQERREAGGDLLALGAAGRRIGWIVREAAERPARLHLLDLDTREEQTHPLPKVAGGLDGAARLTLAADGRAEAEILRADPDPTTFNPSCSGARIKRPQEDPKLARCRDGLQFTEEGFIASRTGGASSLSIRTMLERFDHDGHRIAAIQRQYSYTGVNAATDGDRIAIRRPTCLEDRVVLTTVSALRPARENACPVRIRGAARRVGSRGIRVTIQCPRGCRVGPGTSFLVTSGRRPRLIAVLQDAVVILAGGHRTLRFRAFDRVPARERSVRLVGATLDGSLVRRSARLAG